MGHVARGSLVLPALLAACGCGAASHAPSPPPVAPPPQAPVSHGVEPGSPAPPSAGPPLRLIAIGESWTSGQGDDTHPPGYVGVLAHRLAQARPGSSYLNFGCAGWSAPQLLREGCDGEPPPVERLAAARPTHVTVLIGANDVADWRWEDDDVLGDFSLSRYEEALSQVHDHVARTGARIVQLEVPDLPRFPVARTWSERKRRTLRERITDVNAVIRRHVAARRGVVVPLHAVEALYAPSNFVGDGLHLNHQGYTVVADAVWATLRREVLGES